MTGRSPVATLFHQQRRTAALDFARDLAMQMRRHTRHAARQNLAALGDEFFQEIGVLVIDRFDGDVDPAPRHGAIGAAKSGTAFGGLGFHLFRFAVQGVPLQEWIVFFLFKTVRRARAFLVPRAHVARDRFAERFRLGAFESDNFLRHESIPSLRPGQLLPHLLRLPRLRPRSIRRVM